MSTLWFNTNIIYGYKVNSTLGQCKMFEKALKGEPFYFEILIPEINEGLHIEKVFSLMHYYVGFDPKNRSLKTIEILGNCLKEIVKALQIPISGDLDFYSGINGEPFFCQDMSMDVDIENYDFLSNVV